MKDRLLSFSFNFSRDVLSFSFSFIKRSVPQVFLILWAHLSHGCVVLFPWQPCERKIRAQRKRETEGKGERRNKNRFLFRLVFHSGFSWLVSFVFANLERNPRLTPKDKTINRFYFLSWGRYSFLSVVCLISPNDKRKEKKVAPKKEESRR